MKKILIISMLLISNPLFSGHHAKGEMSNAEVVKKAYATFGSGDIEGWKKLHTSDLKFLSLVIFLNLVFIMVQMQ